MFGLFKKKKYENIEEQLAMQKQQIQREKAKVANVVKRQKQINAYKKNEAVLKKLKAAQNENFVSRRMSPQRGPFMNPATKEKLINAATKVNNFRKSMGQAAEKRIDRVNKVQALVGGANIGQPKKKKEKDYFSYL